MSATAVPAGAKPPAQLKPPQKAIWFAWIIEICAVILGLVNAYMSSLDRADLPFEKKVMIAAPFAMIAVAELSRIPLVQLFFYARSIIIRGACLIAVIATAGLTVENFAFGIERLVSMRVEDVTKAISAKNEAEVNLKRNEQAHGFVFAAQLARRDRLAEDLKNRDAEITRLETQLDKIREDAKQKEAQHSERCKAAKQQCASAKFLERIDLEAKAQRAPFEQEHARQRAERETLAKEFMTISADIKRVEAERDTDMQAHNEAVTKASATVVRLIEDSQMHRIAASWYGVKTTEVNDEQFGKIRTFFSMFSAIIISIMGSMLAIGYYARGRKVVNQEEVLSARARFWRALRGYYLRKRFLKRQSGVRVKWLPHPDTIDQLFGDRLPKEVREKVVEIKGRMNDAQSQAA